MFRSFLQFLLITALSFGLTIPSVKSPVAYASGAPHTVVRVLNLVYDPVLEFMGGERLRELFGWGDPYAMTEAYNREINERSHGFVQFETVKTIIVDGYPPQSNGLVYTDEIMYHRLRNGGWLNLLGLPEDGPTGGEPFGNSQQSTEYAQSFKAWGGPLARVRIGLSRVGSPSASVRVALRDSPTGPNLAVATIGPDEVRSQDPNSPTWVEKDLWFDTTNAAVYYLVLQVPAMDPSNHYILSFRTPSSYEDGEMYRGTSWVGDPDSDMAAGFLFGHGTDYVKVLNDTLFTIQGETKTIAEHVKKGTIDEVYMWGGPWFGYWESSMAGPGAFFINGGVYPEVDSGRVFAVMGFNYERGVAEMLHDLGHRTEATMAHIYGGWQADVLNHNWARFAANHDQSNGRAGCGTAHWPPNAQGGYDYDNPREVESYCDTFYTYPNLDMNQTQRVSNMTWRSAYPRTNRYGVTDSQWSYFAWWYDHLPHFPGVNSEDGRLNNWWRYIFKPEYYKHGGALEGPENQPPRVDGGEDRTVPSSGVARLQGWVTDDGLPQTPGRIRVWWSRVTGPGDVVFTDPEALSTEATFSADGTYVLRIAADDGELMVWDEVTVVVTSTPSNGAPAVPSVEGPANGSPGVPVSIRVVSRDPEGQALFYRLDWGDGTIEETERFPSGTTVRLEHTYDDPGDYRVAVQAVDEAGAASGWSVPLVISVVEESRSTEVVTTTTANIYAYFGRSRRYTQQAQSFTAVGDRICRISVALARYGNPTEDIRVHIRTNPRGADLATATIGPEAVRSSNWVSPTWVTVSFPGCVPVSPGDIYYLVLTTGVMKSYRYYRLPLNRNNPYQDGMWHKDTTAEEQPAYDMLLRITFGWRDSNTAPDPAVMEGGPSGGWVGDSYTYSASASDPDGDRIRYTFSWGDGAATTTGLFDTGVSASASHVWDRAGTYNVRVRAEDEYGAQGPWSDPFVVMIEDESGGENRPPEAPAILDGASSGVVGEEIGFSFRSTDPDDDGINLVVDWGDGLSDETDLVSSGATVFLAHAWQDPGTYEIRAQAIDESGASSRWSPAFAVEIESSPGEELVVSDVPTGTWYLGSSNSRRRQAQSFQAIGSSITGVSLSLVRVGEPQNPIVVTIRRSLTGAPLASTTVDPMAITSTDRYHPSWVRVLFPSQAQVTEGRYYLLVLEVRSPDGANYYRVGYERRDPYPDGMWYIGSDGRRDIDMTCTITFGP